MFVWLARGSATAVRGIQHPPFRRNCGLVCVSWDCFVSNGEDQGPWYLWWTDARIIIDLQAVMCNHAAVRGHVAFGAGPLAGSPTAFSFRSFGPQSSGATLVRRVENVKRPAPPPNGHARFLASCGRFNGSSVIFALHMFPPEPPSYCCRALSQVFIAGVRIDRHRLYFKYTTVKSALLIRTLT